VSDWAKFSFPIILTENRNMEIKRETHLKINPLKTFNQLKKEKITSNNLKIKKT